MKSKELFESWKEEKRKVDVPERFADEAMEQIYKYERERKKPTFPAEWIEEFISAYWLARAGLVVAAAVAGFVRVAFVVCAFLSS